MRLEGWFGLTVAIALAACRSLAPSPGAEAASPSAQDLGNAARAIEAHVRFLADDLLEGRDTGTRGFDLAALYVASQYRAMGLLPAGDEGSYFQRVRLLQALTVPENVRFEIERDGKRRPFELETEFIPGSNFDAPSAAISAPMAFVGHGVHAPEQGYDDFAGIDLKGKIAVLFFYAPARFPDEHRAYYASRLTKARALSERGAVGMMFLNDPRDEKKVPWERVATNWRRPSMRLIDAAGAPVDDFPELSARGLLRSSMAQRLFAGSPYTAEEVFTALAEGKLRAFDLVGTAHVVGAAKLTAIESRNVVAKLPGNDATLAGEHVVFSAHLDHVGMGAPVGGDTIYNGALDNALGVGIMLEIARSFAQTAERPKRSILFLAVTAEEKGLLGATHFARFPTVPVDSLVANINLDMPLLLMPQKDVVVNGIEHSTLRAAAERATRELGVAITLDPFPEANVFISSDQYAFVRQGVPALYLNAGIVGTDANVDGKALADGFISKHYHRPSDDVTQPIHYPSAARLAVLSRRMGLVIANDAERPRWNEGDFFGSKFGKKALGRREARAAAPR